MKRLVQLLMLVVVVLPVMAVDVAVIVSNQGTANYWGDGDVVYNEQSWTGATNWTFLGNNNDYVTGYQTVLKFPMADFTSDALSASLSAYRYDMAPHDVSGVIYFQLQHITQATSGPIVRADVTEGGSVIASNQGTANYWGDGDVVYNGMSWTGDTNWTFLGNNNDIVTCYQTVIKFPLATLSTNASSATLSVYRYDCAPHTDGAQYVQLQHITQATSGPIVRADVTVLTGENIGAPRDTYSAAQPMIWDVKSYINADRANGFACSSFRFIAVDAQGNWLQTADTWAGICTDNLAPGNLLFSPNISAVENIGAPLDAWTTAQPMIWDVANYVNADRASGFDCSSYRVIAVDANGNLLQTPNAWAGICTKTLAPGNLTFSPNISAALEPKDCNEVFLNDMGISADLNYDCHVDMKDLQVFGTNWLGCTTPDGVGCVFVEPVQTGTIARGIATIDGSLNEWNNQLEWVYLDNSIFSYDSTPPVTPPDITEAKMALRWDAATESIYGAVVVTDANHVFRDDYIVNGSGDWDSSDRIEVYSQGSAAGGSFDVITSEKAQQYFVGHKTEPVGGTWATVAAGWPLHDPGYDDPCFVCVTSIEGNNIIYEFRIKQFDNLHARDGAVNPTVVSQLQVGKVIGFDVVIDDRWGINARDFGVLASNTTIGRSGNADNFTRYTLVEQPPCGAWGQLAGDFDGDCRVNFKDMAEFALSWLLCNEPGATGCIKTW